MFWDESQLPLAIFILKVVKCWCKFHQVTCWCFSSNRCSSIDAHAWGMFPSMREQSQALWVPWGWAVSEAEAGGTSWWRQWCTSGCLLAPDTLILHYRLIFCSSVFKDACDTSQAALFNLFSCLYHWVQLGAKGQHKIGGACPTQGSFDFWFQEEAELDEKQFPTWNFLFGSWEGC